MYNKYKKNPYIISAIFNVLVLVIFYTIYIPYNQTNDDTGMAAIVSNVYGSANEYMVFSNVIYAKLLNWLYSMNYTVHWYSLVQLILTLISMVLIGGVLTSLNTKKANKILVALIIIFFSKDFYLTFQFTKVATITALAGYIYSFHCIEKDEYKKSIIGASLLICSGLIRYKCYFIVTVFACIYGFMYIFIRTVPNKKSYFNCLKKYVGYYTLILFMIFSSIVVNKAYYAKDAQWDEYLKYNRIRADLFDYGWDEPLPNYNIHKEEYEKLGISENDYLLYKMGCLTDSENMPIERMEEILLFKEANTYRNYNMVEWLKSYMDTLAQDSLMKLMVVIYICLLFYIKDKKTIIYTTAIIGLHFLFYGYMYSLNRIINWLLASLTLVACVYLLVAVSHIKDEDTRSPECIHCLIGAVGVILCLLFNNTGYDQLRMDRVDTSEFYQYLMENKENIYIADRNVFRWNYKFNSAFNVLEEDMLSNQVNLGGWIGRSPIMTNTMEKYGIDNMYKAMFELDNVYLYTMDNETLILEYLREHYNDEVEMYIVENIQGIKVVKYY